MNNINEKTQIPYGYISASALDSELVDTLMYSAGVDHSMNAAIKEVAIEMFPEHADDINTLRAELVVDWVSENVDDDSEFLDCISEIEIQEPIISGVYEGVEYATSWLGGALNFFILKSPVVTDKARRASPCVPNAGILDTLDGDVESYNVPDSWRRED